MKKFAVIGNPIKHSLSPQIHSEFAQQCSIDLTYEKILADDEITFIEVKSGNSQLNKKQRHIRDQVKAKLVNWKEVRIK